MTSALPHRLLATTTADLSTIQTTYGALLIGALAACTCVTVSVVLGQQKVLMANNAVTNSFSGKQLSDLRVSTALY